MKLLERLEVHRDWGLLILRLAIGITFILHGTQKWAMWGLEPGPQMSSGMLTIMKILSIAEPLGGLALIVGLLSQPAALGLAIIMAGAIYMKITTFKIGFIGQNTAGWELDLVVLTSNVLLFLSGPGRYSLGSLIKKTSTEG
jgi:putative oxidoreductase